MPKVIVSDTSCLILLDKLEQLSLLKSLFGIVTITQIVADEYGNKIPDFIQIENPKDNKYQMILETFLDAGESSSIALALEKEDCLLIIDEYKGRREAKQLKLNITGTVGILIVAKEKGLIQSITNILDEAIKSGFRISDALYKQAIIHSGE
jgi:predicted nucleic acid-binding protein